MKKLLLGILLVFVLSVPALQAQNALANLAATMSPGDWKELLPVGGNQIGTSVSTGPDSGNDIVAGNTIWAPSPYAAGGPLEFATKLNYDTVTKTIRFYGGIHNNMTFPGWYCPGMTHVGDPNANLICAQYFIYGYIYGLVSNTWGFWSDANGKHHDSQTGSHADGRVAGPDANGNYYRNENSAGNGSFKWTASTGLWTQIVPGIDSQFGRSSDVWSHEYFPEAGLVIAPASNTHVAAFNVSTGAWTQPITMPWAGYYPNVRYNKHNAEMLLSTGADQDGNSVHGRTFWLIHYSGGILQALRTDGALTTNFADPLTWRLFPDVNQCGVGVYLTADPTYIRGNIVPDPSGHYVLFGRDASCNKTMWDYNPTADSWLPIPINSPGIPALLYFVNPMVGAEGRLPCTPVEDYGVIACLNTEPSDPNGANIYLFKLSGSGGSSDTTAPSQVMNLHNTGKSAMTAELMWTASTDNIAVAGYNIYRNGTSVGSSSVPIYNDAGLAPNTTYAYTVRAFDAAGNSSMVSATVNVTTDVQSYTFAQKCALAGNVYCNGFDDFSGYEYNWPDTAYSAAQVFAGEHNCNAYMASAHPGKTQHPFASDAVDVDTRVFANMKVTFQNGNCVEPLFDSAIKHSGAGSIKFVIPDHSDQDSSGEYADFFKHNINGSFGYIGPAPTTPPHAMATHLGDEFWMQLYQRFDTHFFDNIDNYAYHNYFYTMAAGATRVYHYDQANCSNPGGGSHIPPSLVGKYMSFRWGPGFTQNVYNTFQVTAVDPVGCYVDLSSSPTPTAAGGGGLISNGVCASYCGYAFFSNPGSRADGQKGVGVHGDPNNTDCCAPATQVVNNFDQLGLPRGYYYRPGTISVGTEDVRGCVFIDYVQAHYVDPPCLKYKTNVWHEITIHIKVTNSGVQNGIYQKWMDGQLVQDLTNFGLDWAPGVNGLGQFNLTPYNTQKDPNQSFGFDTYAWYDDVIISTQPIPMGSTTAACTTPDHLLFSSQPSNAAIGASLGSVQVGAYDSAGTFCGSDTTVITIANKAGTCTGMSLSGTLSGANQFTTTNLTESAANTCTLHATGGSLTAADSTPFTITSGGGMDNLVFSSQPTNVVSGSNFAPPVAVTANLAAGGPDTAFAGSVTLNMNSCGALSTGTASQTASIGVAIFAGLGATGAATGCAYTAAATGTNSGTSGTFNVTGGAGITSSGRGALRKR